MSGSDYVRDASARLHSDGLRDGAGDGRIERHRWAGQSESCTLIRAGLATIKVLLEDFADRRLNVVALSRSESAALQSLAQTFNDSENLVISHGDVAKDEDNKRAVDDCIRSFGRLDALVLNAGSIDPLVRLGDASIDDVRAHFEANTISLFSILKHALPYLRKADRGRVIFTGSGAATNGYSGWGPYSASKSATNSICRTLAAEEPSIVAVSLSPGPVDTGMQDIVRAAQGIMDDNDLAKFTKLHASNALTPPAVIGSVLASLAVGAEPKLSGQFLRWDSDELAAYRKPPQKQ